jgi:hypothetical protein
METTREVKEAVPRCYDGSQSGEANDAAVEMSNKSVR